MNTIRFIHCADLHLDRPFQTSRLPESVLRVIKESAFDSFARLVDIAVSEQIDFFIISGDLYDLEHRSIKGQLFLKKQAGRLNEVGIPLYIIHGNHDPLTETVREISLPANVHVFGPDTSSVLFEKDGIPAARIYGFSYGSRSVTEDPVSSYIKQKKDDALYHIAMLHGQEKMQEGHDPYAPFSLRELTETSFDYWALGHIHKRQILSRDPFVVYPGNIQGGHKNEQGSKGGMLVELAHGGGQVSFLNTSPLDWHTITLQIEGMDEIEELFEAVEESVSLTVAEGKSSVIQLAVTGSGSLHDYLTTPGADEDILEEVRALYTAGRTFNWIETLTVKTLPSVDREREKEQQTVLGDLMNEADQLKEAPDLSDEALASLYEHRTARKYLKSLSTAEKKELIERAEHWLISRLVKEGGT
ncbi:metallophosphoesterase family protein [Alteribacter lacisalsi]|nr:DNA repair exonuclease [Alteribacter lacisalsi]